MMDPHIVTACPECDEADIQGRVTVDPTYRCTACGATFDKPVRRRSRIETADYRQGGDKTEVVREHIAKAVRDGASPYFKARTIGEEVDLSSKQVGNALKDLENDGHVEKWGSSKGATWMVTSDPEEMLP